MYIIAWIGLILNTSSMAIAAKNGLKSKDKVGKTACFIISAAYFLTALFCSTYLFLK